MRGGLALDDREVLTGNPLVEGGAPWSALLLRDYWAHLPAGGAGHYRPLAVASLRLDHALWGGIPRVGPSPAVHGYHLTNLLLHLAVVLFAAGLLRERGKALPLFALALFAVHPALADSVAWISGRTSMLSALGGLFGARVVVRAKGSGGVALGAGLGLLLALLGKEDGIVFVPLLLALAWERRDGLPAAVAGIGAALALYLVGRHAALGSWLPEAPGAPLAGEPLLERLRIAGGAGLSGLRLALVPIAYPPLFGREAFAGTSPATAILAFGLCLGALSAPLWMGRRGGSRDVAASLALAAAATLPMAQVIPAGELLAPRFLYLPLLFAVPAIEATARALAQVLARRTPRLAGRAPRLMIGILILLAWERTGVYRSRRSYWEARAAFGETAQVQNALGNAALEEGDPAAAETAWRRAIELRPSYSRPWVNLATLSLRAGRPEEARERLLRAVRVGPRNPLAWAHLGRTYGELGRPDEAVAAWERALQLSPSVGAFWRGLARAREAGGDLSGARHAWEGALRLDPGDRRAAEALSHLREGGDETIR